MTPLKKKLKVVEHENITNQTRIESLENWVLKQNETILDLNDKLIAMDENGVVLKERKEVKKLNKKFISSEIEMKSIKRTRQVAKIKSIRLRLWQKTRNVKTAMKSLQETVIWKSI